MKALESYFSKLAAQKFIDVDKNLKLENFYHN